MAKNPEAIENRAEQEPILGISVERASETSAKHPDRNEDAALGDLARLEGELVNPPKLETADPQADTEVMKKYGEMERQAADKLEDLNIAGAFDGVSGEKANGSGTVASRIAAGTMAETLANLPAEANAETTKQALTEAFAKANQNVREYAGSDPNREDLAGAATTGDIIRVVESKDGPELVWGHAGDSRIYVLDGESGKLRCLTTDDGVAKFFSRQPDTGSTFPDRESLQEHQAAVTELDTQYSYLDKLKIQQEAKDPEEAAQKIDDDNSRRRIAFQKRNVVANQIGVDPEQAKGTGIEPFETGIEKIKSGDRVLISSDGIHDNLSDDEIAEIMRQGGGAAELKQAARQRAELSMRELGKTEKTLKEEFNDLNRICGRLKTEGGPLPPNATVEQANQAIHQTSPEERQAAAKYLKDFDPNQEINRLDLYQKLLPELRQHHLVLESPKMDDITAVEVRVESLEVVGEDAAEEDGEQLREMAQDMQQEVATLESLHEAVSSGAEMSASDRRTMEKLGGPEGLTDRLVSQKIKLVTAERSAVKADFDRLAKESGFDPEQQLDQAVQETAQALAEVNAAIKKAVSEPAPDTEQKMGELSAKQAELLDRQKKLGQARELSGKMAELSAERQRLLQERKQQKSNGDQEALDQARRELPPAA
jgi:serine/threonine protein phosphatase PrpC